MKCIKVFALLLVLATATAALSNQSMPAPSVFYGPELVVAPKQPKTGLINQDEVRKQFEALKSTINTGGK